MPLTNQELFLKWVEEVENSGRCVKFGYYEDGYYYDRGTLFHLDFNITDYIPDKIIEITPEHFWCSYEEEPDEEFEDDCKEIFYADEYPTDEFGQIGLFRSPPKCYLTYMDNKESTAVDFLNTLDTDSADVLFEDLEHFMDWANDKYPNSISFLYEDADEEPGAGEAWFWECHTYNPKYSQEEIRTLIKEYIEDYNE